MKLPRRRFLHLAAGAAALPALSCVALAQAYPTRPVRLIVPAPAGGPSDIIGRLMGQWLSEHLGQPFVVDNRPGAGTNVGTEAVVRAPPDGYTLLLFNAASAINATLYSKLDFVFVRDIVPIAAITREPLVMQINPFLPVKTIPEFIAHAKAALGSINMASGGNGAPSHVTGELFKMMAGVNLVHVPYRGAAPALTDLISGQVQVYFGPMPSSIEHIKTGKLRALAVTTAARSEIMPEIPAMAEFLPGYDASTWFGIGAPRHTAVAIVDRLNAAINAGLADPRLKARLADLGGAAMPLAPAAFGKLIAEETEKWAKVIKFAGIKPV
jgi:tripartite-type tricarboxylate transporter receptor subunit TctC